jgi:hypothetical protein
MPGYILCQAQGGLNDIACQIWHCTAYAIQHKRSIILTKSAYFQTNIFDIFDFSAYPVPVYPLEKLKSIAYDDVAPPYCEEYVKCFLDKDANQAEISKHMQKGGYRFDKSVFFSEKTLLLHDTCGGGSESLNFFRHIKFTPHMIKFFKDNTKGFPTEYNALHIRNTDIKTNVFALLQNINTSKLPLFIATDDTHLKSYISKTYCKTFSTSFETDNGHNLHYVDAKFNLEWAIVDLLCLVFSQNTMLSIYEEAGVPIQSGYTYLIDGLKPLKEKFRSQIYPKDLAVLLAYFNPCNSKRILMNFLYTYNYLKADGVPVYAIECLFPNQKPSVAFADVRVVESNSYFFYKEALFRLLETTVPVEYTKLLFLDADLYYTEKNWYNIISASLDVDEVVQPYKTLNYLDLTYKHVMHSRPSYVAVEEGSKQESSIGMAWAMTRDYYNRCGFFDYCLLGSGDTVSAIHFTNRDYTPTAEDKILRHHKETHAEYSKKPKPRSFGYCDLVINHLYHGSLTKRGYWERNDLLTAIHGDVSNSLITNDYGLFEWKDKKDRDMFNKVVYRYFHDRDDDGLYDDINCDVKMDIKYKPHYF